MLKCIPSIVGRINVYALYRVGIVLFKSLQGKKIITVDKHIAIPLFPVRKLACLYNSMRVLGIFDE